MPIFVVLRTNTIDNDPTSEIHFVGSSMEKCMDSIKDYIKRVPLSYKYDRFEIEEWNLDNQVINTTIISKAENIEMAIAANVFMG